MFKWLKTSVSKILSAQDSERSLVHIDDDGFMSEDIQVNIEDIIAQEDTDDIGKLHILSLSEFHKALGDTWEQREAKVFLLTEAVLRDNVGTGNRWEQRSKEVYIMLFPTLSEMEADARSYDIAEQLGLKIIGERFDGERRPHVRVAGVDPKTALNDDGTLNIEALEKAGRAGELAGDPDTSTTTKDKSSSNEITHNTSSKKGTDWTKKKQKESQQPDDWEKNQHASQESDDDWHKNKHASQEADTNWKKNQTQHPKAQDPDPQWTTIDKTSTAAPQVLFELSFAPCWERATQSFCFYKSVLTTEKLALTPEEHFNQDLLVLKETAKSLVSLGNKKIKTPLFISIHSTSLREIFARNFFDVLEKIPKDLTLNYLIINIIDDAQWQDAGLGEIIASLKKTTKAISFSPASNQTTTLCKGFDWVSLDLSSLPQERSQMAPYLKFIQDQAREIQAKLYISNITKREQLSHMLNLEVDLLSGPVLVRSTKKIRPPFNLAIERLQKAAQT